MRSLVAALAAVVACAFQEYPVSSIVTQDPLPECDVVIRCNGDFCADTCAPGSVVVDPWFDAAYRFQLGLQNDRPLVAMQVRDGVMHALVSAPVAAAGVLHFPALPVDPCSTSARTTHSSQGQTASASPKVRRPCLQGTATHCMVSRAMRAYPRATSALLVADFGSALFTRTLPSNETTLRVADQRYGVIDLLNMGACSSCTSACLQAARTSLSAQRHNCSFCLMQACGTWKQTSGSTLRAPW